MTKELNISSYIFWLLVSTCFSRSDYWIPLPISVGWFVFTFKFYIKCLHAFKAMGSLHILQMYFLLHGLQLHHHPHVVYKLMNTRFYFQYISFQLMHFCVLFKIYFIQSMSTKTFMDNSLKMPYIHKYLILGILYLGVFSIVYSTITFHSISQLWIFTEKLWF